MKRVAINGFGRIGKMFLKIALEEEKLDIVAINDLVEIEDIYYLFKHDTIYGEFEGDLKVEGSYLVINGKKIKILSEKDPSKLPWKDLDIDIVIEATGAFASYEKSNVHLKAGSKKVIVSAPVKDVPKNGVVGATVLVGLNEDDAKVCNITSNGSCTTNAVALPLDILDKEIGIESAILNTIHSYTSSQRIQDGNHRKDNRLGRAAALNIIPSTTGAAIATTKVLDNLENKFDGLSIRVPAPIGSLADITFIAKKDTTIEEINEILRKNVVDDLFSVSDEGLVSSDIIGRKEAAIIDLQMTRVVGNRLVKIFSWYDNEAGYTNTLHMHAVTVANSV